MLGEEGGRGSTLFVVLTIISMWLPLGGPSVRDRASAAEASEAPSREGANARGDAAKPAQRLCEKAACYGQLRLIQRCTEPFIWAARDFFFAEPTSEMTASIPAPGNLQLASVALTRAAEPRDASAGDPGHPHEASSEEPCCDLPDFHDSRVIVATVVDPVATGLKAQFDEELDAIIRGIERSGYERDRFWTPWHRQGGAPAKDGASAMGTSSTPWCAKEIPGIMLFRSSDRLVTSSPRERRASLVLLLVGETPTWGVHPRALFNALNMAMPKSAWRSDAPPTIQVLGPTFSGTAFSLARGLEHWRSSQPIRPVLEVTTGTASSAQVQATFDGARIAFSSLTITNETLARTLYRYLHEVKGVPVRLEGRKRKLAGVATLSEGGTVYGEPRDGHAEENGEASAEAPLEPEVTLRFPMHIALVRATYDEEKRRKATRDASPLSSYVPATSLDPVLDDTSTRSDTPRPLSRETAVSDDLLLSRIISTIDARSIRYLGILATDPADTVFLAEQLRERRPDVRLFTFDAQGLYSHPSLAGATQGMLIVSPYTLRREDQSWVPPFAEPSELEFFASSDATGIYNAAMRVAWASDGSLDAHAVELFPGRRPAAWISAVGTNGARAISFGVEPDGADGAEAQPNADCARAADASVCRPKLHPSPSWGLHAVVFLGLCVWQLLGFFLAFWIDTKQSAGASDELSVAAPRVMAQMRALLSVVREKRDLRCLVAASLAVGSLFAIVTLVMLPFVPKLGNYDIDHGPMTTGIAVFLAALAAVGGLSALRMVRLAQLGRAGWLCSLLALSSPMIVPLIFFTLRPGHEGDGLFLLRSMELTGRLSPMLPMLFVLALLYVASLVVLTLLQVDFTWSAFRGEPAPNDGTIVQYRAPSAKRGLAVVPAALAVFSMFVVLLLKPIDSFEGRFADHIFFGLFLLGAAIVTGALGLFVASWLDLSAQLKEMTLEVDGERIADAIRRLPQPLTRFARIPLSAAEPARERERKRKCLRDLLDWVAPTERLVEPSPPTTGSKDGNVARTFREAREKSKALRLELPRFWTAFPALWPSSDAVSSAGVSLWLRKAEELVAACEALTILPMLHHLEALLVLAVGGSVLCGLMIGSYAFQPERLLNTIFSLVLMASLVVALLAILWSERNKVLCALLRRESSFTWKSFLSLSFKWIALPLLAFLALQYPVATNQVSSWLDPVARLAR